MYASYLQNVFDVLELKTFAALEFLAAVDHRTIVAAAPTFQH